MKTEVVLTVDTEFSAGGYFEDPPQGEPVGRRCVDLEIDGQSQGLGFLLETLLEHDLRATFFVEAAHVLHFGHEPMGGVTRRLRDAGQDIQLHLHPMWLACENATTPEQIRAAHTVDLMGELEPDQLRRLLALGLEVFQQWGLERPVAVRAGNLSTSREVYRCMAEFDLPLASHVGAALLRPKDPDLVLHAGRHRIEGVLELPVLTYRAFGTGLRLLTITSSSFAETRRLIEDAHRAGVEQIVILTHCHEFVKRSDKTYARIARNRVNQKRLVQLCRYLRANPDRFATATFGERGKDWLELPPTDNPLLVGPALPAVRRMVANKVNDTFWRW